MTCSHLLWNETRERVEGATTTSVLEWLLRWKQVHVCGHTETKRRGIENVTLISLTSCFPLLSSLKRENPMRLIHLIYVLSRLYIFKWRTFGWLQRGETPRFMKRWEKVMDYCEFEFVTDLLESIITLRAKLLNTDWSMKRVFFFLILLVKEGKIIRSWLVLRLRFEIVDEEDIEELNYKSENENTNNSAENWKNVFKKRAIERNFKQI